MSNDEMIASVGVFLLLVAYFMNLADRLDQNSRGYQGLNAVGAGLAAYASYLIGFIPFVVLEGTWMLVSVGALARGAVSSQGPQRSARPRGAQ